MEHRTIEPLFEPFRRRGDVAALGVVFDRTAPELFRVAQHLAGDVHTAEDALQSAFLAAIEDAHAWNASRPLLPWRLGVLAKRVRELTDGPFAASAVTATVREREVATAALTLAPR